MYIKILFLLTKHIKDSPMLLVSYDQFRKKKTFEKNFNLFPLDFQFRYKIETK